MTPTIKIEKSVLDIFNRDVQRLMRSRKTTPSQLGAARLYAKLNGFVDSEPKPEEKIIADEPPAEGQTFPIGAVVLQDGKKYRVVAEEIEE